jgi:hypothetical protein
MARTILLIAAPEDYECLIGYCTQLALRLLPMELGQEVKPANEGPACFLGPQQETELHPYGNPPVHITDVKDPLLLFVRPYYMPPYLVDGQIRLNEDNKEVSEQIRPTFEKLRRWVRKTWHKTDQFASYIGPQALELLNSNRAQWRSNLHSAKGHVVVVNAR